MNATAVTHECGQHENSLATADNWSRDSVLSVTAQAPALPIIRPHEGPRLRLMRQARMLSLLSIGWMTAEAGVAVVAALLAGSVALLGFGLDSLIELTSATAILSLYTGSRGGSDAAERRAQQLIAMCFATLALYLAFDSIDTLAGGTRPDVSWLGAAVTAGAIVFMPLLARAKGHIARKLNSAATAGDAAQSWLCAITAAAVLHHLCQRCAWMVVA